MRLARALSSLALLGMLWDATVFAQAADPPAQDPHAAHQQPAAEPPPAQSDYTNVPPLTDADRQAAFPDVEGHSVHDRAMHSYVLIDQLEWQRGDGANGFNWDSRGWIGGDRDRFWFRTEGEGEDGDVDTAHAHLLYGRAIARWWDLVAGVRQDFRPGATQTWAAVGIQGLAPYWLDIEATGYVGASGRTQARVEVEYQLLLTNRLMLQPIVEAEIYGKDDPERRIGAGLSTLETGLRLRYEVRRELAPYIGLSWTGQYGKTKDFAEEDGRSTGGVRLVSGVRVWF